MALTEFRGALPSPSFGCGTSERGSARLQKVMAPKRSHEGNAGRPGRSGRAGWSSTQKPLVGRLASHPPAGLSQLLARGPVVADAAAAAACQAAAAVVEGPLGVALLRLGKGLFTSERREREEKYAEKEGRKNILPPHKRHAPYTDEIDGYTQ